MSLRNIFDQDFRIYFLIIFLLEIFSFCGFLIPFFNKLCFVVIILLTLILSLKNIKYGLFISFAELFVSSKGYLFSFQSGNLSISIRIAIWIIVMSVWLANTLYYLAKNKKLKIELWYSQYRYPIFILVIFIFWGALCGYLRHNEISNIFFDLNNWFYFALLLPLYSASKENERFILQLAKVFLACISWLTLESFFLLFIFSHNMIGMIFEVYRWIRDTGVGEITAVKGGFYRIFLQSQIFVIFGFFIVLIYILNRRKELRENKKYYFYAFAILSLLQAVNLLSYSRSNWLGIAAGIMAICIIFLFQKNWKFFFESIWYILLSTIIGLAVIIVITKFPYPNPTGGFSAADLFSERATAISGEAGASSRWALLPELWDKIVSSPITGSGLGATVTYTTKDPRILAANPKGEYTTYAFEWGWLDIWIKFGFLGIVSYSLYLFLILQNTCKIKNYIYTAFCASLISLIAIHIFSPYLNHPLGIGAVIILALLSEKEYTI